MILSPKEQLRIIIGTTRSWTRLDNMILQHQGVLGRYIANLTSTDDLSVNHIGIALKDMGHPNQKSATTTRIAKVRARTTEIGSIAITMALITDMEVTSAEVRAPLTATRPRLIR